MPGMTRPATARRQEDALLAHPRQAAFLTAGVLALTAVVFALAADHGTLARIQRLDDAWLRLMISARAPALTAIAQFSNVCCSSCDNTSGASAEYLPFLPAH